MFGICHVRGPDKQGTGKSGKKDIHDINSQFCKTKFGDRICKLSSSYCKKNPVFCYLNLYHFFERSEVCATFRSTGNRRKHQEISPQETQKSAKKYHISKDVDNIICTSIQYDLYQYLFLNICLYFSLQEAQNSAKKYCKS